MGNNPVIQFDHKDRRELQPFGRVHRNELDLIFKRVEVIAKKRTGDMLSCQFLFDVF